MNVCAYVHVRVFVCLRVRVCACMCVYVCIQSQRAGNFTRRSSHLTDVNECSENKDYCHEHATCTNTEGWYDCKCEDGYTGNGFNCDGKTADIIVDI